MYLSIRRDVSVHCAERLLLHWQLGVTDVCNADDRLFWWTLLVGDIVVRWQILAMYTDIIILDHM